MKKSLIIISLLLLQACSVSIDSSQYELVEPSFSLENFFTGNVIAYGIVQNRSGDVVQRFEVDIVGYTQNNKFILDETFTYGMGEGPKTRKWTLEKMSDGSYQGSAPDIAGTAVGRNYGNAFNFQYEMDLEVGESRYRVAFNDWFWAFNDKAIMNRAYIKKFGIVMAEVTIFMQKKG